MMARTARTRVFSVYGHLTLEISVDVPAKSMEEALDRARDLDVQDFVEILGEYNSGDLRVVGLYDYKDNV